MSLTTRAQELIDYAESIATEELPAVVTLLAVMIAAQEEKIDDLLQKLDEIKDAIDNIGVIP